MSHEITLVHLPQAAGPHPVALVFGVKKLPVEHARTRGRAHTRSPGRKLAVFGDIHRPTAPRHAALTAPPLLVAKGHVARHEERPVGRNDRAERIFMVMSRQWP